MNKNDTIKLYIEDIGTDGEGIGHVNGFTVFVKDAAVGDEISAKIMKVKKNYAYARLESVIKPSVYRVTPICPVAAKCGGCQIQHIAYAEQLNIKSKKVLDCLIRIGGIDKELLKNVYEGIIGMEEPQKFRNKAQYPVQAGKDGAVKLGFYAYHSHNIIENDECMIEQPVCAEVLKEVRQLISRFNIAPYNEETSNGVLRHVLIRTGFVTKEIMLCFVVNANEKETKKILNSEYLREKFPKRLQDAAVKFGFNFSSLCININTKKTNVIMGDKTYTLYGNPYICDYIGNIKFQIHAKSFFQVNPIQTKKLYEKVLAFAAPEGNETVWDLYSGIGTISLFLAQKAKHVISVEIVPEAIKNAIENAKINGITNVTFKCGAAEIIVPQLNQELTNAENIAFPCDTAVVDPPRAGCDIKLLETLIKMNPQKIVYVSCDPATLARDLKYLLGNGYELKKVCAVDQFGHSMHVETVCLLSNTYKKKESYVTLDVEMDDYYRIKNGENSTK